MKENSAAVHAQVPVEVATYLLNEKRAEIAKLEARLKVDIVLIPNKFIETPHYKLDRLKHDDERLASYRMSYNLADTPDDENAYLESKFSTPTSKQEAMVKGVHPEQPPPAPIQRPAPVAPAATGTAAGAASTTTAAPAPQPGLFGMILNLFRRGAANESTLRPGTAASQPAGGKPAEPGTAKGGRGNRTGSDDAGAAGGRASRSGSGRREGGRGEGGRGEGGRGEGGRGRRERGERGERRGERGPDRGERSADRGERADQGPDRADRTDRADRPDRPDRPDRADRGERAERNGRGGRDRPPRAEGPRARGADGHVAEADDPRRESQTTSAQGPAADAGADRPARPPRRRGERGERSERSERSERGERSEPGTERQDDATAERHLLERHPAEADVADIAGVNATADTSARADSGGDEGHDDADRSQSPQDADSAAPEQSGDGERRGRGRRRRGRRDRGDARNGETDHIEAESNDDDSAQTAHAAALAGLAARTGEAESPATGASAQSSAAVPSNAELFPAAGEPPLVTTPVTRGPAWTG